MHMLAIVALATPAESMRVAAFTPSASSAAVGATTPTVKLLGVQPLTMTFTHAVIALGSDWGPGQLPESLNPFLLSPPVAGSVRWVTTSIARFDPDERWPTDLHLSVGVKPGLTSYEGLRTRAWSCTFRTPSTGAPLGVGAVHRLLLPAGTRYHSSCGPLGSAVEARFSGLLPFSIPFRQTEPPADEWRAMRPSARRQRLLLRHGLAASVAIDALAAQMSLRLNSTGAALPLMLSRPGAAPPLLGRRAGCGAVALLEADLLPDTRYTLSVSGSGRHSYTTFDTAAADAGLTLPDGQGRPLRFASGAGGLDPPDNWPAVVQGGPACLDGKKKSAAVDALLAGGTALSSFPFPGSGEAEARTAPLGGALRRGTRQLPTRLF
ncbi:hypothetical protein EMIHUDRAFT_194798 [Emiliania huxleyi CCMP1516]|uniref:Uncharacterized protein n=2 Tax=Emiliania huxleyi TaxID=2903 RepID=A0A0D3L254_EMIH1|nr:hypothetical protein EMIHUDRAFT_194798 [Emiliania huxleyi CCMP1516]EOD42089.1 hypothetical protein EMIHUDRAFT_194798 [Emiliania huxleyi CCMP1516]|eukprot:XP_005794518.1 hypothetical protein EMIHUDRAFT_194798 [Emiliania huxleyi CCMP1516]